MLSYGYWQRRFGGDPSVIGSNIQVDSQTREIVGVMPRGFKVVNQDFDLLIPFGLRSPHQILAGFGYQRHCAAEAGRDHRAGQRRRRAHARQCGWTRGPTATAPIRTSTRPGRSSGAIRPMKQEVIGNVGSVLWVVMGTIGVVMLIACTNVANLLLVRAEARQQELAVRAALGAGRGAHCAGAAARERAAGR